MPNRAVIKVIQNRDFLMSTPEKSVRAGICTERDLVHKILAPGLDVNTTPVSAIMTPNPQTISPDKPFGHALHLMFEGGYRHMPVIAPNGLPIGVLSARDALGLEVFNFASELAQRETLTEVL